MVWRRRCLTRTSATAEISISAPLSTHALRFCATSPQDSDGVEEEARHLHTAHNITSHTKRLHTPTFPLADLPVSRSRSAADRSPFVRQDAPGEDELDPGLEKEAAVGRKRRAPSSSPPPRDGRREMGRASGVSDEVRCAKCGSRHTQRWGWDGEILCEACYLAPSAPGAAATKWRVGDRVHARHGSVRSMSPGSAQLTWPPAAQEVDSLAQGRSPRPEWIMACKEEWRALAAYEGPLRRYGWCLPNAADSAACLGPHAGTARSCTGRREPGGILAPSAPLTTMAPATSLTTTATSRRAYLPRASRPSRGQRDPAQFLLQRQRPGPPRPCSPSRRRWSLHLPLLIILWRRLRQQRWWRRRRGCGCISLRRATPVTGGSPTTTASRSRTWQDTIRVAAIICIWASSPPQSRRQ